MPPPRIRISAWRLAVASGSDIPKMEVELRSIQREIEDLRARLETATASTAAGGRSSGARGSTQRMMASGVIDTTKVTRTALQNAASIASLMLTTEAMVAEIPEKKPAPGPGGPHGPEGMDY